MSQNYKIKAGIERITSFTVTGLSLVTSHKSATADINALWEKFFKDSIGTKIPNKADDNIYAVYSDYQGDHTKPYRLTIGYKVTDQSPPPQEMHSITIEARDYAALSAQGLQPKSLIETWTAIWESDMNRAYQTDFEFYGPKFFEEGINEVLLYIGLNETK